MYSQRICRGFLKYKRPFDDSSCLNSLTRFFCVNSPDSVSTPALAASTFLTTSASGGASRERRRSRPRHASAARTASASRRRPVLADVCGERAHRREHLLADRLVGDGDAILALDGDGELERVFQRRLWPRRPS